MPPKPTTSTPKATATTASSSAAKPPPLAAATAAKLLRTRSPKSSRGRPRKPVATSTRTAPTGREATLGELWTQTKQSVYFIPAILALVVLFAGLMLSALRIASTSSNVDYTRPRPTATKTTYQDEGATITLRPPTSTPTVEPVSKLMRGKGYVEEEEVEEIVVPPPMPAEEEAKPVRKVLKRVGKSKIQIKPPRDLEAPVVVDILAPVAEKEEAKEAEETTEATSVEDRLKDGFAFREIVGEDSVNAPTPEQQQAKVAAAAAANTGGERKRTLAELQEAMKEYDADELTQMLNKVYRGQ